MTDPFDVLRDPGGLTEPDATFRARLMVELRTELAGRSPDRHDEVRPLPPVAPSDTDPSSLMEITMHKSARPPRQRYVLAAIIGTVAAASVIVALIVTNHRQIDPPHTVPPAAATTSTSAPKSDADIAEAGLLTATEIGDAYRLDNADTAPGLKLISGTAATIPACSAFVDSVFENPSRAATVRTRQFQKPGVAFSQYVVVFPTEQKAIAMMDRVADPTFPTCLGAYVGKAYDNACCQADPYTPVTPHPLRDVGDQIVNIALSGRLVVTGQGAIVDEGAYPFVRVGRAVVMFNPPGANSIYNSPGYPDAQLDQTLELAVAKLRAAQLG